LAGRKIGLVGYGRIGRAFARLIKPFDAELLVSDPYTEKSDGTLVDLDELISSCSVIVLAAALTPETKHLINERRLASMVDGTFLINVARGGLIDLEALLIELRNRRITAALDVTDPLEPLPPDHELRKLSNVILTPHIAAGGLEMRREIGALAVNEVLRFASGLPQVNVVTREMLATMT
jgi:phosphoglycerate dehydrogenase-like enzyme